MVLPVSDTEMPEAAGLLQRCTDLGLRAQVAGPEHGSLGARIRAARLVPYQAVIGAKEATDDQVALSAGRQTPSPPPKSWPASAFLATGTAVICGIPLPARRHTLSAEAGAGPAD